MACTRTCLAKTDCGLDCFWQDSPKSTSSAFSTVSSVSTTSISTRQDQGCKVPESCDNKAIEACMDLCATEDDGWHSPCMTTCLDKTPCGMECFWGPGDPPALSKRAQQVGQAWQYANDSDYTWGFSANIELGGCVRWTPTIPMGFYYLDSGFFIVLYE
jgi:hypothetical protein